MKKKTLPFLVKKNVRNNMSASAKAPHTVAAQNISTFDFYMYLEA